MENVEHSISIENRKKINATAIDAVEAFSRTQIVLGYKEGRILISGENLKITSFSQTSGAFMAVGEINGVKYLNKGLSIKQKLFK